MPEPPRPGGAAPRRPGPLAGALIMLIRGYQRWVSPLLGPRCRFYPSCSAYAVEALRLHGAVRGSALTAWRLLRCQPFHPGGFDPVPPPRRRGEPGAEPGREGAAVKQAEWSDTVGRRHQRTGWPGIATSTTRKMAASAVRLLSWSKGIS